MDLIQQFIEYTEGIRTCSLYRKWSAITMVGGAMERRVKTTVSAYENYPNLYTMLVGPPASGKGIIDIVHRLWKDTRNDLGIPAFFSGVDDATKAALVDSLKEASQLYVPAQYKYHCLLLPVEEFSNFFARYEPELLSFLTKVYNAPDEYSEQRRKSGKLVISAPIITALLGYQPQLLQGIMLHDAADQGFLRRTILIWNDRAEKNALFESTPLNTEVKSQICKHLSAISELYGEMKWTTEAQNFLQEWDMNDGPPRPMHDMLQYYVETRTQHVIKLSMIASVSETLDMTIDLHHVQRAISWLLEAEAKMPEIFDSMRGDSDRRIVSSLVGVMLKMSSAGKPITPDFLIKWLFERTNSNKIPSIIATMEAMKVIEKKPDGNFRPTGRVIS
jgi:hypothetical protein